MPVVTRSNLCANPSFESSTTGWSATGTPTPAIAQSAVFAQNRTKSLQITWATGNTFFPGAVIAIAGLTVGLTYTYSGYVYVPSGSNAVQLIANGSGLLAGSAVSTSVANNIATGERLSVTFTASATAHNLGIYPSGSPTAGMLCYLDSVLAENSNAAGSYFDGASSGCVWTGTADLSTSQQLSGPLSITTRVDLLNEPPRVAITVSGVSGISAQVTRTDPDGNVRPVRGADPATLNVGQWIGYDYEMPYGKGVTYTVIDSSGPTAFVASAPVTTTQARMIHPGQPALSIQIRGIGRGDRSFASGSARHDILGSKFPKIISDGARKSGQYQLTLRTAASVDTSAMKAILAGCIPLLLQVAFPFTAESSWQYISIDGVTEGEVTSRFGDPQRLWTLDVTEVDRPAGGVAAQRTWADALAESGTWQAEGTLYATWAGALTGIPGT